MSELQENLNCYFENVLKNIDNSYDLSNILDLEKENVKEIAKIEDYRYRFF